MREKKLIWIMIFLLIMGTVGISVGYITLKDRDYKLLVKQINVKSHDHVEIDQALYDKVVHKIEGKLQKNVELKPIEQFFLGYQAYFNNDYESAYDYYMPISRIKISEEDGFVNVLINKHLNRICIALDKDEEGIALTKYWTTHYEKNTVQKYALLISTAILELSADSQYTDTMIECLETILENNNTISDLSQYHYYYPLSTLYTNEQMYGSALEAGMKALALAQLAQDDELICAQMVCISVIYTGIGNYAEAKAWIKQCFEVETGHSEMIAGTKVGLAIHYIRTLVALNEFDEVDAAIRIYEENIKLLDELYLLSYEADFKMAMLQYYIAIGDEALAKAQFKELEPALQEGSNRHVIYLDAVSMLVLGEYYLFIGENDTAIEFLEASIEEGIPAVTKEAVQLLLDYYIENGDIANIDKYTTKLKQVNEDLINDTNTSYVAYANQKYEYERKVEEINATRIRNYLLSFAGILLATVVIGVLWSKVHFFRSMNQLDGLTQVYNRGYFNKQYEMMKQKNEGFYLVILDIDNFKSINDTYGHVYGDYVIKNVAQIAKGCVGKAGRIYRYGGEEFVIILSQTNPVQVAQYAEQVRKGVEAFKWVQDVKVTVSIGGAYNLSEEYDTLNAADQKLYEAKHTGKNKVCIV